MNLSSSSQQFRAQEWPADGLDGRRVRLDGERAAGESEERAGSSGPTARLWSRPNNGGSRSSTPPEAGVPADRPASTALVVSLQHNGGHAGGNGNEFVRGRAVAGEGRRQAGTPARARCRGYGASTASALAIGSMSARWRGLTNTWSLSGTRANGPCAWWRGSHVECVWSSSASAMLVARRTYGEINASRFIALPPSTDGQQPLESPWPESQYGRFTSFHPDNR